MLGKLIVYALLLLPGFIALKTAIVFGHHSDTRNNLDNILSYMVFGIVSNMIILWLASAVSFISADATWESLASQSTSVSFIVKYMFLSLLVSTLIGAAWSVWFHALVMKLINRINVKFGRNEYFTGSLLARLFDDGQKHFLIIQKNGQDIGVGFFYGLAVNQNGQTEISLTEYPEYRVELNRARAGKPSYLANRLQSYVNSDNGTVIYETEFPPEWAELKQEPKDEKACSAE